MTRRRALVSGAILALALVITSIGGAVSSPPTAPVGLAAADVAYTQNFDTLASTGSSNVLPTGWSLSEAGTSAANDGKYTAGTGSGTGGDTYSFGAASSTERALGTLLSGTLTPTIGAAFTNNTGGTITGVDVAYAGEQWRLGATGRADRLDFQYSLNATDLTTGTWTDVDPLDYQVADATGTAALLNGKREPHRRLRDDRRSRDSRRADLLDPLERLQRGRLRRRPRRRRLLADAAHGRRATPSRRSRAAAH